MAASQRLEPLAGVLGPGSQRQHGCFTEGIVLNTTGTAWLADFFPVGKLWRKLPCLLERAWNLGEKSWPMRWGSQRCPAIAAGFLILLGLAWGLRGLDRVVMSWSSFLATSLLWPHIFLCMQQRSQPGWESQTVEFICSSVILHWGAVSGWFLYTSSQKLILLHWDSLGTLFAAFYHLEGPSPWENLGYREVWLSNSNFPLSVYFLEVRSHVEGRQERMTFLKTFLKSLLSWNILLSLEFFNILKLWAFF